MSLATMYPAKNNSPITALTAGINSSDTTMTVDDVSALPAAPNLAVIGSTDSAEIVLYTAITGSILTIVRGQHGTTPGVWPAGSPVARNMTALDLDTLQENIRDLDARKIEGVAWGGIEGNLADQADLQAALNGKQSTLQWDTVPTSESTKPVTSGGIYTAFAEEILYFTDQSCSVTAAATTEFCRISNSAITANTVVLECMFSVPYAITSDVSWTSASGYISLTGICTSSSCKVNIVLGQKGN